MKKALILFFFLGLYFGAKSQTIVKDSTGNYIELKRLDEPDKLTGKTFTDTKGHVYPVYISKSGKLYIIRLSKTATKYKQYLKVS